jgi:sulfite exporter TauE/SafE
VIGILMGLVGATLFMAGNGPRIQGGLSLAIGVVMLVLAAGLLGWLPTTHWVESSALQGVVAGRLRGLLTAPTVPRRLALGLANGWLPCGPVFSAAMAAAATGSVWRGGVAMLAFGIGTVPVLLVLGLGAGRLGVGVRRWFNRIGALCLLLIAAQLILRGLSAWGVLPHFRIGEFVVW